MRHHARRALALAVVLAVALGGLAAASGVRPNSSLRHHQRNARLLAGPRVRAVTPGKTVRFAVSLYQRRRLRRVAVYLNRGLPPGSAIRIDPRPRRNAAMRAWFVITTSRATPPGRYPLRIAATFLRRAPRGRNRAIVRKTVTLVVRGRGATPPFTITGSARLPLTPGSSVPLDLTLANPHPFAIVVSTLDVSIASIDAPAATAARSCGPEDFSTGRFAGFPVIVPARASLHLSDAGVIAAQWPRVSMLDRELDQDGCKGATLELHYGGTASRFVP